MNNINEVWTVMEDDRDSQYLYGLFLSKESAIAYILSGQSENPNFEIVVSDEGENQASIQVINTPYKTVVLWYDIQRYELADLK